MGTKKDQRSQEIQKDYSEKKETLITFIKGNIHELDNMKLGFIDSLIKGDITLLYDESQGDYEVKRITPTAKAKNRDITLDQIINQPFSDVFEVGDIITETHIIIRYDDHPNKWEIYSVDQAEDSDPDPLIISEDPKEILKFLYNN